ncbi:S1C family serine protease [Companilactobacillus metriopterae]|uniref:S1C family serine protease n=1 Tax=Companilactobacillus metriopterae TaxID=1909267 RepID=UPI00100AFF91|nr:trypsin-like peptidase domain-containing protein [Companilactobacillus metriopterae]
MDNNNPERRSSDKNRGNFLNFKSPLFKTAIVALISAMLGVGIATWGFSQFSSSVPDTTSSSGGPGTTQVSTGSTKSTGTMTKAYNKVDEAVVSVVNLQKQSKIQGDSSSIFGDLFGDSSDGDSSSSDSSGSDNSGSDSNSSNSSSSSDSLQEYSEGSGVIYSKENGKGYIVTNNHVVDGSDQIEIILKDGTKLTGKLIGSDATTDLAVIEIDGDKVPAIASFGNSDSVQPADSVIAIGSPLGSEYATSVTQGIVSATNRTVQTQDQTTGQTIGEATVIQTDAAINPGNSGGPLVNSNGQIIGINSMKLTSGTDGTSVEGMGFAIPSNEVVKIINQLVKNGKVERPSLGISVIDLDQISDDSQTSLKVPSSVTQGVVVAQTNSGSVAKKAGISKNDIIVKLGSKKIASVADLHSALYEKSVGDKVKIKYYHNGKLKTASVHLTEKTSD